MILIQIRKIDHGCTNYIAYIEKKHLKPKGTRISPTNYKHPHKKIPPHHPPPPHKKKATKKKVRYPLSTGKVSEALGTFSCLFFLADVALISN